MTYPMIVILMMVITMLNNDDIQGVNGSLEFNIS